MNPSIIKKLLAKQNNTRNFSHLKIGRYKRIRPDILRSNILIGDHQILPLIGEKLNTIIDLRIPEEGGGQENTIFIVVCQLPYKIRQDLQDYSGFTGFLWIGYIALLSC